MLASSCRTEPCCVCFLIAIRPSPCQLKRVTFGFHFAIVVCIVWFTVEEVISPTLITKLWLNYCHLILCECGGLAPTPSDWEIWPFGLSTVWVCFFPPVIFSLPSLSIQIRPWIAQSIKLNIIHKLLLLSLWLPYLNTTMINLSLEGNVVVS